MNGPDDKKKRKKLPNQTMLLIRAFLAAYLLYLAVDILKTEDMSNPRKLIIGSAVVFIVAGAVLLAVTIRQFVKGEYEGGKADYEDEEQND